MAVNSFREDEQMENGEKKQIIIRLFSYLKDHKKGVLGVLICMAVTVAISLVNPLIIENAIDQHISVGDWNGLVKIGIFALVLNVIYMIMVKIRMYVMSVISNQILLKIRQELYEHIQLLSFSFFDSRPTGKILARIIGDVNSLKDVLTNAVTTLIPDFITVLGVVVIMLVKDWKLAIASLCTIPLMIAGIFIIQRTAHKRWQIFRKKSSNLNAYVHEDIAGIGVVQSFRAENETREVFEELTDEHQKAFVAACRRADMFGPTVDFCWGVGTMMLYLIGVKFIGAPAVSVGLLVAFGTYINMFWNPIMNLSNFYNQLVTNLSAAERIFDILDTKPDIQDESDVEELPEVEGKVEFSHVSFTYDKGTPAETKVLSDVNFTIQPGETIALVGPTGAGKTTIVNLISRFYDIEDGHIYIDGHDLKKVSIHSLRRQMGVMTQDNFIFHGTVRENILYGKMDATEEEMIAAAKAVNAHDFIMKMEKGYDTELKERGAGLSIGQRQLIAFARTMISMPKILILDEATSSIDTHTEILVQHGIEALLAGRTSFVIAHRLSTIQNADRIFVIDNGGIVEQGSPKELLARRGAYYELYMAQFADVV
ncbi:ABC transporter ATP-binding protein [Roseburia sp. MUC/MUC-530-WT-4D]|uniref:ABC transporter ATP-binding protein n=1 Tax=Roseburia porci TaxID=2605790 RepID=A0A6L5YPZ6_9FIRM|nr:ABC transporter ATP-binding protein [Roseburia porci]MCI5517027.1 ABC transporter ATP-binding protein/permease [Roseburia sp.]MDD6742572.1 ABC transporter ATP-binding protein [Roseburia porci]MST74212.1 ABC transporter ATP-binding protein [Roseburia porci]